MTAYYTVEASHTTSGTAATQTLAADTRGGGTRTYSITRIKAGASGTTQDNQCLWQAWKPTVVNTAGSAQAAEKHDPLSGTATTTFQTTPTVGTKGAFPVVSLAFNSRAFVQWAALNQDEALTLSGVTTVNGNMAFYDEQAAGVAVAIRHGTTWCE